MARIQSKATDLQKKTRKEKPNYLISTLRKQYHISSQTMSEKMLHRFLEIWRKSNSPTPCKSVPGFPLGGYATQGLEPHLEYKIHLLKNEVLQQNNNFILLDLWG